jgi:hypothetical protein
MKTQHFFIVLAVLAVCFTACKKDPISIPVTDITLNYEELTLIPGDTITLIAIIQPDDATYKSVIWESSDTAVVTVNSEGMVIAVTNGEATITATIQNGNIVDTCFVTVDYRTKWVGDWDFVNKTYEFDFGYESWDTIYYSGKISLGNTPYELNINSIMVHVSEDGHLFGFIGFDGPCGQFEGNDKVGLYFNGGSMNGSYKWSHTINGVKKKAGKD